MWSTALFVIPFALAGLAKAHIAAFHPSMYCFNGTGTTPNLNTNDAVDPLYMLSKSDYWFHHINKCDEFPPLPTDTLELPAGGTFTVELAVNRAQTSYTADGEFASDWPDGKDHPDDYSILNLDGYPLSSSGCIESPNFHTQNQSMASGTAFAISYTSTLSEVTMDNLVVFSVRYKYGFFPFPGPLVTKQWFISPAPRAGAYVLGSGQLRQIPNGCGQSNIYMGGFKCTVTNATSTTPLGTPKPPVWCEDDQSKCVQGPKQIMIWNQLEDNNIEVDGFDLSGHPKSPAYNSKCGFQDGAQDDIFATSPTSSATTLTKCKRMLPKHKRSSVIF
ncbi:hypothetical protein ID866_5377 [Astraeus odoratus]|nr:hypothetical protein ID866_5377 [Astraeus odoratus]